MGQHNGHKNELVEIHVFHIERVFRNNFFEQDKSEDKNGVIGYQSFTYTL